MIALRLPFRQATPADAAVLAELVNYAGEGMPLYLWEGMAGPGETACDVGRKRAARGTGGFSYRNAAVIEHEGRCAGALIGYAIADQREPIPSDMPPMFVPLQELENLAPSTWYVNVLAVVPELRNRKLGWQLLDLADETGLSLGLRGMSVIVSDTNAGAQRLYERHGYRVAATRAKVKEGWQNDGREWVLLTKDL
jgi:ribosomal protein S18 acetylase RimI-like enzyme